MNDTLTVKEMQRIIEDALLRWYEQYCDENVDCIAHQEADRLIIKINKQTFAIKIEDAIR